ncbi:MAG TPA: hypothetical protein VMF68_13645 [Spirochaetia bacterium]|nr:hypothetical protein [Spirochaetia bacterium]
MKKLLLVLGCLSLLVLGCTSVSQNDAFLLKSLDDQSKAQALTNYGIQEYDLQLTHREAYDQIPRIRQYFTVALTYDPGNTQAQQYLSLIDNFKAQKLSDNVTSATKMLAKAKRTDDDNYALFVSLQTAARIDPADANVKKMLSDTSQDRSKLVDSYLAKSKALMASITDATPDAQKQKGYTDALAYAKKALDVDPTSSAAQSQVTAVKGQVGKLVTGMDASIEKLIAASKFTDARTQLNALNDLNRRTSNSFDVDVSNESYSLSYAWAKYLYAQKDYATAESRVDAALAIKRSDEAAALKRQIAAARSKADAGVSFDAALADIDRLIGQGELVSANRRIVAVAKVTTDQTKLATLSDRKQSIVDKLQDLYTRGVQAYQDEDFKTAIELLQTVVGVQVDYQQAGDYLDRARSKQKVLDQLQ